MAKRWNARAVLLVGVLLWTCATLLVPLVAQDLSLLVGARVLVGVAEGVNYPAQVAIVEKWVPSHEHSRAWTFLTAGEVRACMARTRGRTPTKAPPPRPSSPPRPGQCSPLRAALARLEAAAAVATALAGLMPGRGCLAAPCQSYPPLLPSPRPLVSVPYVSYHACI